ncbi:hypothetical protein GCM10022243_28890 [Saccharothrix violaceirubra]|uniref:Uncharacterized protein n=1 Tax=Saccharothrix violaceirubra TaxID=413306 RepID=A0A7W7T9U7_9PSEU|nr:hypothetical protein [Saccharothrix violaceirubra]MBB4969186.1 hypothetical protein [Saccharothrix violaceirubra]
MIRRVGGPSGRGAALEDEWTRYCLEIAGRRAFGWVLVGVVAFVVHLVVVSQGWGGGTVGWGLLVFAVVVLGLGMVRRPAPSVMAEGAPWKFVRVHWRGGRLVVHGDGKDVVLDVTAGPLARGRINRHRRAWVLEPGRRGETVVTFRGVPRLFAARVLDG